MQDVLDSAAKPVSAAEDVAGTAAKAESINHSTPEASREAIPTPHSTQKLPSMNGSRSLNLARIPHSTERMLSVELTSDISDVNETFENGDRPKRVVWATTGLHYALN